MSLASFISGCFPMQSIGTSPCRKGEIQPPTYALLPGDITFYNPHSSTKSAWAMEHNDELDAATYNALVRDEHPVVSRIDPAGTVVVGRASGKRVLVDPVELYKMRQRIVQYVDNPLYEDQLWGRYLFEEQNVADPKLTQEIMRVTGADVSLYFFASAKVPPPPTKSRGATGGEIVEGIALTFFGVVLTTAVAGALGANNIHVGSLHLPGGRRKTKGDARRLRKWTNKGRPVVVQPPRVVDVERCPECADPVSRYKIAGWMPNEIVAGDHFTAFVAIDNQTGNILWMATHTGTSSIQTKHDLREELKELSGGIPECGSLTDWKGWSRKAPRTSIAKTYKR